MNNRERWEKIVARMTMPENRRTCNSSNLKWFLRNGAIHNMKNLDIMEAINLSKKILREMGD